MEQKYSVCWVVSLLLFALYIFPTIFENININAKKLKEPVQTEGSLIFSTCQLRTMAWFKGHPPQEKYYLLLRYSYSSIDNVSSVYTFETEKKFDSEITCEKYKKDNTRTAKLWYEKSQPEKAALSKETSFSWGNFRILLISLVFATCGLIDQKFFIGRK